MEFYNKLTMLAYLDLLDSVPDPVAFANQWQDMGGESAAELLGKQLEKDARAWGRGCGCDFERALILEGLKRVKWEYVARRLLRRAWLASEVLEEDWRERREEEGDCGTA